MDQEHLTTITDVREVWLFVRRNVKPICLITLVAMLLAFLVAIFSPARYAAEAIIMLDARQTNLTGIQSVVSNLTVDSPALRSEIDIIQSRAVIDRVIEELNLM